MDDGLTEAELAQCAEALDTTEVALRDQLAALAARAATVELDQAAMGRVSRGDALQQQAMAAAERRRLEVRLVQVRRARTALQDEDYGACARCGETIALPRLLARPETPFCIRCAQAVGA